MKKEKSLAIYLSQLLTREKCDIQTNVYVCVSHELSRIFIRNLQFLLIIRLFAKSYFIFGDFPLNFVLYFFPFIFISLIWSRIGLPLVSFCSFGYARTKLIHSFIILFCMFSNTHSQLNSTITIAASGTLGSIQLVTRFCHFFHMSRAIVR